VNNKRSGNIWDRKTGKHVAWIEGDDVFSVATKRKFAVLRGAEIYDLNGKLLGHLDAAGKVGGDTAASDRFTTLAEEER
jgi:hypothetical protein